MSNIPIPEHLDPEVADGIIQDVFFWEAAALSVALYAFGVSPTRDELKSYENPEALRRLLARMPERDAALLILRTGLDGGGQRTYKQIAPQLAPPISASHASYLGRCMYGSIRRALCEELREKRGMR